MTLSADLPIPMAGLRELLGGWSGEGALTSRLWQALASVAPEDQESPLAHSDWEERDIRRRAQRILLERLRPELRLWPSRLAGWSDALPAVSTARMTTSRRPLRPTNWIQTARRFGWPPQTFVGRIRTTIADELLLSALRWTLPQLLGTVGDAERVLTGVSIEIAPQIAVSRELLNRYATEQETPPTPSSADLRAVARAGPPWNRLAPVAATYLRYRTRVDELAYDLIYPLESLRWRLFHLGVLGQLLAAWKALGADLRWRSPLSGVSVGPQYEVALPGGQRLDLWFEAGGIWSYYRANDPYREMTAALGGSGRAIGADLLLIDPGHRALIFECKYSASPGQVGRQGYLQAVAYASEVRTGLATTCWAFVVGPTGVVHGASHTGKYAGQFGGPVGMTSPEALAHVVQDFLAATSP